MVNLIFVSAPYQKRNRPFGISVSSTSIALVFRVIRGILTEIYSLEKDDYDLECEIGCFLHIVYLGGGLSYSAVRKISLSCV
jgi:hypothetical protein